jgi:hypothetical protein
VPAGIVIVTILIARSPSELSGHIQLNYLAANDRIRQRQARVEAAMPGLWFHVHAETIDKARLFMRM